MSSDISGIYKTIEYIKEHIADNLTIEKLSEVAGFSKSHFALKFRQITGYTPFEMIRKFRLARGELSILEQENVLDVAVDNGYGSNEAFTRAFRKEFGVPPYEFKSGNVSCSVEQLNDMEKLVAYMPAPGHKEYFGHLYYQEHKDIYDSLIEKGYFDKKTLGYRMEAKQLTEKYAYDFEYLILHTMKSVDNLEELYNCILKVKDLPRHLFYTFIREMAVNGMLKYTKFEKYDICAHCDFCNATLTDSDFIRNRIIMEQAMHGIHINLDDIYCMGLGTSDISKYCPYDFS